MFLIKDFKGFTNYEKAMFGFILIAQLAILVYFWTIGGNFTVISLISAISSIAGVACVVMSAKGRLSTFVYGLIQVITYGYVSYKSFLYGEVGLQIVFGIFQFIGAYTWIKNMHSDQLTDDEAVQEVDSRGLTMTGWIFTLLAAVMIYFLAGNYLHSYTDAKQPFVDAIAVGLSLVGQTLMTLRYKEQWFFWMVINAVSIFLWTRLMIINGELTAEGVSSITMWVVFLINSVYGYYYWKKLQHVQPKGKY
ncbi:nicotinamide riboside transporter PnuC [Macrococcus carouselicus]|uniref:Nicotinamide riboside transporter PnuC n=1 Tax=Macrococcus carouselicus TaxID=69969 RepID=A0A9Q8CNW9_9STAP|nr:nicotinamide riboside transporter PnuC [Macrococcus carouselicus]TDM04588.1 nicotinamide riboside transporter PnuC [Macrococcus carouselicus]